MKCRNGATSSPRPVFRRCEGIISAAGGTTALLPPHRLSYPVRKKTNARENLTMTTRRDFLKAGVGAAAGIAFCSCGLLAGAHAQQPTRAKLPVMVNGKRVKTIDVHSHCLISEANALLGEDGA